MDGLEWQGHLYLTPMCLFFFFATHLFGWLTKNKKITKNEKITKNVGGNSLTENLIGKLRE